ncbi:MAG TPA: sigma-70 family RNA polymerase sigma factor [Vicinamibacterales bacterium]|nr:sigma-70 family RNA polymerase sigma factor [Vicinamibacterales bacterium]
MRNPRTRRAQASACAWIATRVLRPPLYGCSSLTRGIGRCTVIAVSRSGAASLATATDADVASAIALQPAGSAADAESELYRRFAPRVRLFGLKHLRDEMAAQDLAQQVLLMTIERLRAGEIRNVEQIGSFILGASRLTCGGIRRTERRRQDLHARFEMPELDERSREADVFGVEAVGQCLAAIRERERTILIQTYYAERSTEEIATALGMTAGAVRVGRHRALATMRECLDRRRTS